MSLVDNISAGLKSQGISTDKIQEVLGSTSFASSLTNTATSLMKEVQSALTSSDNMLTASLSSIASSFPDAATSIFGNINTDALSLSNITSTVTQGAREVDSKLQSLASNSAEAIAQPVAFVTKTVQDTISGVSTMTQRSGIIDLTAGMDSLELSNISKATGIDIKDSSDLTSAIKSVTSEIATAISEAPSNLSSLVQSVTEPITSTIENYSSSLMNGLDASVNNSILGSVSDTVSSVITGGEAIDDAVLDTLPSPVNTWLSKTSDNFINETATKLLGDNQKIANYILNKFSSASDSDNILQKVINLGDSSSYPQVTDEAGGSLSALLGNGDQNQIKEMYNIAKELCPNITNTTSTVNYRYNKDLYDVMLQLATELGMTDLINQLKRCQAQIESLNTRSSRNPEDNSPYWDERSVKILQTATTDVVYRGDIDTYRCIQENIGSSQLCNTEEEIKILVTNLNLNVSDETEVTRRKELYNNIISDLGYTTEQLVTETVLEHQALKGADITAMSATNTDIIDDAIDADTRLLVQSAMYAYAS